MPETCYLEVSGFLRMRLQRLTRHAEKFVGLLSARHRETAPSVLIEHCHSVHTIGMAFELDLCFIDRHMRVVRVARGVKPGRVVSARAAVCVVERPARDGPWLERGERVRITPCRAREVARTREGEGVRNGV